jgi:hypothetical protein
MAGDVGRDEASAGGTQPRPAGFPGQELRDGEARPAPSSPPKCMSCGARLAHLGSPRRTWQAQDLAGKKGTEKC